MFQFQVCFKGRRLNPLKAPFESGSSHFSFKRFQKPSMVNPGFNLHQPTITAAIAATASGSIGRRVLVSSAETKPGSTRVQPGFDLHHPTITAAMAATASGSIKRAST